MSSNQILKGSIQETMLGPLWARAEYGKIYPQLLKDEKAIEIIKKIAFEFEDIKEYLSGKNQFRGLGLLARAREFDIALKNYINQHPKTTVVNLGAGLDTTFHRVDNGEIKWYDLDLPNAINFRKNLIPEGVRNICVQKSVLDISWFDEIEWNNDLGIFFIAGGLVYYFKEEDLKLLFRKMSERFSGGEIVFDAMSRLALTKFNQMARKVGKGKVVYFYLKNPNKIFSQWSEKISVKDWYPLWKRTEINKDWDQQTKKMINLNLKLKTSKIVLLKFRE